MWMSINGFNDPVKGSQYQSKTDEKYIIDYLGSEGVPFDPVFTFKSPSGEVVKLNRTLLAEQYVRWIDPWGPQKAFAKKFGYVWKDEVDPPTPSYKIET